MKVIIPVQDAPALVTENVPAWSFPTSDPTVHAGLPVPAMVGVPLCHKKSGPPTATGPVVPKLWAMVRVSVGLEPDPADTYMLQESVLALPPPLESQ